MSLLQQSHMCMLFYTCRFSCDEGVTWYTYNIFEDDNPDEPNHIYTVGMFTELGEKVVHAT